MSYARNQYLSKLLLDNEVDLVAVHKTHAENNAQLRRRPGISGYELLSAVNNRTYGDAPNAHCTLKNASHLTTTE